MTYALPTSGRLISSDPQTTTVVGATGGGGYPAGAFVLTLRTTTAAETVTISGTGTGYSYDIDWGDGNTDTSQTAASPSHEFAIAGDYEVTITGTFPRVYYNNAGDKNKVIQVNQWGNVGFTSMADAFEGCINLESIATNISDVSDYTRAFQSCTKLVLQSDLAFAGTSGTIFAQMFSSCSAAAVIPNNFLDSHSATNVSYMFANATVTSGDFGTWDWTNVTTAVNFLINETINTTDYNASMIGIEAQAVQNSVSFHGGNSVATGSGLTARNALVSDHSWTITDNS